MISCVHWEALDHLNPIVPGHGLLAWVFFEFLRLSGGGGGGGNLDLEKYSRSCDET